MAVLDSGGVAILVGYKPWVDAIYAPYGAKRSADGYYRLPCTTQISLSFNFGGINYAAHPLDLSWPDPDDMTQTTCIGAIQYSSSLGTSGDFILGSSFLKNVYSIYQYPDNEGDGKWQPTVGLISITNASVASQDFYAVRVQRQSLSDVSSNNQPGVGPANPSATSASPSAIAKSEAKKATSTAVIAGCSVVGFFVFAAGLFCAWWFWYRRRHGKNGIVTYPSAESDDDKTDGAALAATRRSRKHDSTHRQKSYIDGISDYEDSWLSTTEGGESIALGYIPEVPEEDEEGLAMGRRTTQSTINTISSAPGSRSEPGEVVPSLGQVVSRDSDIGDAGVARSPSRRRDPTPKGRRESSLGPRESTPRGRRESVPALLSFSPDDVGGSRYPSAYLSATSPMSMSGPFPSPAPGRHSVAERYDAFGEDYFAVPLNLSSARPTRSREGRRTATMGGTLDSSGVKKNPEDAHGGEKELLK